MTEVETTSETYDFRCGRCGHTWERVFEVRRWQDQSGDEFCCYRVNGVQAVAPGNAVCPRCGGYRVRLLPVHATDAEETGDESQPARSARSGWDGCAVLSEICHSPGMNHL